MESKKRDFNKIIEHLYQSGVVRRNFEERFLDGLIYFSGDILEMKAENEDLYIKVEGRKWNKGHPDYSTEETKSYKFTYKDTNLLESYVIEEIKCPGECKYSNHEFEFYIYKRDRMFDIYT